MSTALSVFALLVQFVCIECDAGHRHDLARPAAVVQCEPGAVGCPQGQRVESAPESAEASQGRR